MQISLLDYLLLMAGMGAVTYGPRWFPLFFLSRKQLPQWLIDWLAFVPVAILSSLLVPILLLSSEGSIDLLRPELLVAIPTIGIAYWKRSLGGTVFVGMGIYWAFTAFW